MSRYKWKCILKGMLCTPLLPCSLHHAICNSTGSPSYHKTLDHIQSTFFPSYLVASPSFQTASPPFVSLCSLFLPSHPPPAPFFAAQFLFLPSFLPSIHLACIPFVDPWLLSLNPFFPIILPPSFPSIMASVPSIPSILVLAFPYLILPSFHILSSFLPSILVYFFVPYLTCILPSINPLHIII